jgi:hypothetical protein
VSSVVSHDGSFDEELLKRLFPVQKCYLRGRGNSRRAFCQQGAVAAPWQFVHVFSQMASSPDKNEYITITG